MAKETIIYSPFNGTAKELSKVDDPAFAEEMVGKGIAVVPDSDVTEVLTPIKKGKVKMAFKGGHAYGIEIKNGIEILIHIGIDTVTLNGKGFTPKVKVDQKIKLGNVLAGIDLKILSEKAPSTDTMVLITNETLKDNKIEIIAKGKVKAGEPLFKLIG
ncbi:MAG: hypothetical protein TYPL_0780 [Candidatus Tyloplasma litorale]|nr:MAG: hypothetical protein TYPL_0780 [Mycoplasmatales bacterium]